MYVIVFFLQFIKTGTYIYLFSKIYIVSFFSVIFFKKIYVYIFSYMLCPCG